MDTYYLVIRADRTMRVAKKPRLQADEVAIRINVKFPEGWGHVIANLDITAPDFTPEVKYEQVEQDAEATA